MAGTKYTPTDRRPIASREAKVFVRLASWLVRRGVSANIISTAGMFFGAAAGAALALTAVDPPRMRLWFLLAAATMQLRLLANMLDGMVAIESGTASAVGELFNEAPDRVADAVALIGAGYAVGASPELGYLAACTALLVAYIRAMGKAAGARHDFSGPMAKQQRMFTLTVAALYSAAAPAAWQPAWSVGQAQWGLLAAALLVVIAGGLVTVARRVAHIAADLKARAEGGP